MFVEDWGSGTPCVELFRRENIKTGLTQYKKVRVGNTVHGLARLMGLWKKDKDNKI